MSGRKIAECQECGELREIIADEKCFACYQRARRRNKRIVDRHSGAIKREHKKLFRAYSNAMVALADLGVSHQDIMAIKGILDAYVEPIRPYLSQEGVDENSKNRG